MLSDIPSESLQNLLAAARSSSLPLGPTGLPGAPLRRGDVIEIQGSASSGKTHLLYHLLVTCVIPSEPRLLNGWNKAAVVFDLDGTFDIRRFRQLVLSRITQQHSPYALDQTGAAAVVSQSMRNLRVFRPSSSLQLVANLHSLPLYHASDLPSSEIALLVIDSVSAFYWQDRFSFEDLRPRQSHLSTGTRPAMTDAGSGTPASLSATNIVYHILQALQKFQLSHVPVTVLSNWGLHPIRQHHANDRSAGPSYGQHLHPFPAVDLHHPPISAWDILPTSDVRLNLTHQITLRPAGTSQCPSGAAWSRRGGSEEQRLKGYVRTNGVTEVQTFSLRIESDTVDLIVDGEH
ncbi:hypothetical protein EVG20_g1946 [Dentipellis fragilis]|uniref:Rad51-like C-terminal domain-containing protein n=1 Tax=Dentipellis fragilis TaxID=205917 RepID=A0A4Y9ZB67_9AGAM|nr:hypothetical protein EVG20_g1946 [Dentipellis fragilis]